jgi:hypothetical protein
MAVTVNHPQLGSASTETRHELGTSVIVEDAHLQVRSSENGLEHAIVAVYAPGQWASAIVDLPAAPPA